MNRKIPLAALALVAPLFGGARGCIPDDPPPPPPECICPAIYAPVCGSDGRTYGNTCEANCAGVMVAHDGECGSSACSADQDCAVGELCEADPTCLGAPCFADDPHCSRYCPGTCQPAACPEIWSPVCGEDGNTYGNDCEARAAHVAIVHHGECGGPVECTSDYECAPYQVCQVVCPVDGGGGGERGEPGCVHPPECRGTCIDIPVCMPVACDIYCEYGHAVDEYGCDTCSCNPPPPPPEQYCLSDDECDTMSGQVCDFTECRSPCEGRDGDEACPAVCFGICRGGGPEPAPPPEPIPASR